MIWSLVGNRWLDGYTRTMCNLHYELETGACYSSPLDRKDREDIRKICEKYNKVVARVYKRVSKVQKGTKK